MKKKSLLDKYDTVEQVSAADWAWITIKARQKGKNPKISKAAIKAHFTMRLKTSSITVLREDWSDKNSVPYYHVIKARNNKDLRTKVKSLYDEIADTINKNSETYKNVMKAQYKKIDSLIDDKKKINIDGISLQVVSDPNFVTVR